MAKYIPGKNHIGFEQVATDFNVIGNSIFTNVTFSGDGNDSYVEKLDGDLYILNSTADGDIILGSDVGDGSGSTVYMALDGGAVKTLFYKNTEHQDNVKAEFGAGDDLEIFHNGTNSFINNDTGDLYIKNKANAKDIIFQSDDGSGGVTAYITLDGSETEIYFHKTVGVGTTNPDTAYKLDVAGKVQVQNVLELDDVLTLNAISTPADPAAGKSSIYMDSTDGAIRVKINVGGTVVTRTIASYES
tara:strand:+ start:177 stop:911 length:735 start_codon:yes stop_codon:yes gene_type:complete